MSELISVLQDLFTKLDALGIKYLIGGSFASSAWGVPRQTHDLDLSVRISGMQAQQLVETLGDEYLVSANEIQDALDSQDTYRSFQLLHMEKVFKIDVFVPRIDEFSESEYERRRLIEVIPGVTAYCAAPENIVLQKLRWYELGNRVSDRQWNDIVQVLEVQDGQLDWPYLDSWAIRLGVHDLLKKAKSQGLT